MIHYSAKTFNELTTKELWEIYQLRVAVFVVEQKCYYQEVDPEDLTAVHLMGVDDNGKLVTYARIIPEDGAVRIGRIVVDETARGNGSGRQLVTQSIISAQEDFPDAVQINIQAQAYLEDFYKSLGFIPTSEVYLETGIPHLDMILTLDR
jgi:ElaA protein